MKSLRFHHYSIPVLLFLLFPLTTLLPQNRLNGRILSDSSPVPDAKIAILETKTVVYTNKNGEFFAELPDPGYYTFRIIANDTISQQRKLIQPGSNEIVFYLSLPTNAPGNQETITSGDIRVVGRKDNTKLSRYRLNRNEIKRLPGAYGDSLKAINTLPGITQSPTFGADSSVNIQQILTSGSSAQDTDEPVNGASYSNSYRGFLVMRGGGTLANQFYLDGFKIVYPYHLGDQSSVIHNDYIRSIDVYTGSFPSKYGNATGGIISITGPENVEKDENDINMSMFKSDAFMQKVFDDGNGSVIASARQSYPNYLLLLTYPSVIPEDSKYAESQDGQFKINYRFNPHHQLTAVSFAARDIQKYASEIESLENKKYSDRSAGFASRVIPPVGLDRSFITSGVRYTTDYSFLHNELSAQHTRYKELYNREINDFRTGEPIFQFWTNNHRIETEMKDDLVIELIKKNLFINTGFALNRYRWELSMDNVVSLPTNNENSEEINDIIDNLITNNRAFRALWDGDRTDFTLYSSYFELEADFWRLHITAGARAETFSLSNDTRIGPRFGLEFAIPESDTTILAGAGVHHNIPPSLEMVSIESGNPSLEMEEAEHMALGVEQKLGKNWLIKLEGYKNNYRNLVVSDSHILNPLSLKTNRRDYIEKTDEVLDDPIENDPLYYSNDGTGYSTGADILIKKTTEPGKRGFSGWFSYGNSITRRNNHQPRLTDDELTDLRDRNRDREAVYQTEIGTHTLTYYDNKEWEFLFDNDQEELYDLDRTHVATLVLNYTFNREWSLGGKWSYATNTPYTPVVGSEISDGSFFGGRTTFFPVYSSSYNSARLKDYHQLDIRLDRFFTYEWGYVNVYMELINVYGRRNEEQEYFNFLYPYVSGVNPYVTYQSSYYETGLGDDKILYWPLLNFGMEIRF